MSAAGLGDDATAEPSSPKSGRQGLHKPKAWKQKKRQKRQKTRPRSQSSARSRSSQSSRRTSSRSQSRSRSPSPTRSSTGRPRPSCVTYPYRSSSDEDDSSADEGPRNPSIAKRPSLPSSPPSTHKEVDDDGGRSRKGSGGDSRRDEPTFDFSSGDTAGEEAVPAPTEGSSPAGGAGDASSPARSNISGGDGSPVDTGRPGADKGTLLVPLSRTPLRRALSPPTSPRRRLPPPGSAPFHRGSNHTWTCHSLLLEPRVASSVS
ncbi:hypothetical protein JG688_00018663 [Phytophthora aleatoria]|uniref:Uncharacterized protein n=1 Tax=Phytophthora aleatoria TaxID=2496075 RepID=A0A8J5HZ96_9STRA|nr:hypothetical protein JG688_00018663 [Phytophthora aleatoria]